MDAPSALAGPLADTVGADSFATFERTLLGQPLHSLGEPDIATSALALSQAHRMLKFVEVARTLLPGMNDLADHPGWVIMLQIFTANHKDRPMTTAILSDLTGCWPPLTTRYVEMMIDRKLIGRAAHAGALDSSDFDTMPLRLTPEADRRFQQLLCGFAQGWPEPHQG